MSARPESARELLEVLESEERLYRELREVLQEERVMIVKLDAAGLEDAVMRKEALSAEGRLLEEGRIAVAQRLADALGLEGDRPTLGRLCDALGDEAGDLREAHGRLLALIGAVRELLDANAGFAGDSLGQVRATLQLLGRVLPGDATYGPAATAPALPSAGSGAFVRRSA
ncbi:MAG: flagellar protein FlgN [Myxococcales bacterium]|nr:flagellar protein FlgN [Myxococcales bacterium]